MASPFPIARPDYFLCYWGVSYWEVRLYCCIWCSLNRESTVPSIPVPLPSVQRWLLPRDNNLRPGRRGPRVRPRKPPRPPGLSRRRRNRRRTERVSTMAVASVASASLTRNPHLLLLHTSLTLLLSWSERVWRVIIWIQSTLKKSLTFFSHYLNGSS